MCECRAATVRGARGAAAAASFPAAGGPVGAAVLCRFSDGPWLRSLRHPQGAAQTITTQSQIY